MNWSEYGKKLLNQCKEREIPFQACFELTPFCNFRCNMCYIRLTQEQAMVQGSPLSTQQWLQVAREANKMGTIMLEVTGGEPVTRPDFSVLYESFIKMGYLIHLRTNGYLIQESILDLLRKYKPRKISVTLYGGSDETYQRVCGVSDGFSVVSKNILAMKEAGLNVRLSMTITKENEKDIQYLNEWADKNDLYIEPFGALINPIRGARRSIDHLRVKYDELEFQIPEELEKEPYIVADREPFMQPFWLCRGFGALFCISWDGRMTLCNTFTEVWEAPLKQGVEKAYHNMYSRLKSLRRPDECVTCKYIEFCSACPSRLQSVTGKAEKTCEEVCKFAKRKYKYYKTLQLNRDHSLAQVYQNCEIGDNSNED